MTGTPSGRRTSARTLPSILGLALVGLMAACGGNTLTEPDALLEVDGLSAAHTDDPETRRDCMKGGWEAFGFEDQGQCIRFVMTGKDSRDHDEDDDDIFF